MRCSASPRASPSPALLWLGQQVSGGSVPVWLGWGIGFFAVGWLIQFIGHWYEGRKPAFVDDVIGLVVAPMFIVAEAMFMLGWNKPLLSRSSAAPADDDARHGAHRLSLTALTAPGS
jgi:uncharacterized membrane protein YGL010W